MIEEHPEFLALMDTCRLHPADNAPRLILSDWLEEHDEDAWSEFIRLQIEGVEFRQSPIHQHITEELFAKHWQHWIGDLPTIIHDFQERELQEFEDWFFNRDKQVLRRLARTKRPRPTVPPFGYTADGYMWEYVRGFLVCQMTDRCFHTEAMQRWMQSRYVHRAMRITITSGMEEWCGITGKKLPDLTVQE